MTATDLATGVECVHCKKQRRPDRRLPCEHCGLRPRDKPAAATPPALGVERRVEGSDLVVIASDPQELVAAQHQMIARLDERIAEARRELSEAEATMPEAPELDSETARNLVAAARQQLTAASKRLATAAKRRLLYLEKVRAALAAGYVMMPNFPGHVIAIRTARKRPAVPSRYDAAATADAEAAQSDPALGPGEGKYVSPIPEHRHLTSGGRQDILVDGWDEEIALPVEFLHATVVKRTAAALDLRIFDEVVLVRDGGSMDTFAKQGRPPRGRDPMVVGRVILRTPSHRYRSQRRVLSFLIAWFMDTKAI